MTCPRCNEPLHAADAIKIKDAILPDIFVHRDCVYAIEWDNGAALRTNHGSFMYAMRRHYRAMGFVSVLAMALIAVTGSASAADYTPTAPIGCVVQHTFEDHSAWAVCAGSYVAAKDAETDMWDIPVAVDTLYLTDDAGMVWAWPVRD